MIYRRPKFLEVLLDVRQEMAREADYDVDLFAEMVRGGTFSSGARDVGYTEEKAAPDAAKRKQNSKPRALPKKA